jgi:hypothetical protein
MTLLKQKIYVVIICSLSMICLLFGCISDQDDWKRPPPPSPPKKPIIGEIMSIKGDDVTVAGKRARVNMYVYENEEIRTGAGSEMTIKFRKGGTMHLYEHTDPIIEILLQPFCYLIRMFSGHTLLDTEHQCFKLDSPQSNASSNSKIDIRIEAGRTIYKVLEGQIRVLAKERPQITESVLAGQSAVVLRAKVQLPKTLTEPELRDLRLRFEKIPIATLLPLPNFVGQPLREVQPVLEKLGMRWRIKEVRTSRVKPGIVVEQNPSPGTKVSRGTTVTLAVETGEIEMRPEKLKIVDPRN